MTIHEMWKQARKESNHHIGYVEYIELLDFIAKVIERSGKEKKDER